MLFPGIVNKNCDLGKCGDGTFPGLLVVGMKESKRSWPRKI
jgi:hypothetical protein